MSFITEGATEKVLQILNQVSYIQVKQAPVNSHFFTLGKCFYYFLMTKFPLNQLKFFFAKFTSKALNRTLQTALL